jgi:MoaA/NifB/PqqE/SkfB family radical SAM enzyme
MKIHNLDLRSFYDRILVKNSLAKPILNTISIEPTNNCNLRCKICLSRGSKRPAGFMKKELFYSIINQAQKMGVQRVAMPLSGEPTLHPQFVQFLKYACLKIPEVIYFTNGNFLDEEVAQESVNSQVSSVNISLDGTGPTHEKMRPNSDYNRVKKNIERLLLIRKDREKPFISVNMSLFNQTSSEIQEFVEEWQGRVDSVNIGDSYKSSFHFDYSRPFWKEAETYDVVYCNYPFYYLAVLWDGKVIPCCDVTGTEVIGDLTQESLQDIWFGERYKKIRKGNYLESCKTCNRWGKRFITKEMGNIRYEGQQKSYLRLKL